MKASTPEVTGSWEILSIFVEGDCHDPVCGVERLLHPVPVVNVNVDVQDPLVVLEKFKDGENDVVDIAEARCFALLCVVESPCPVDCNVRGLSRKTLRN